MARASFYGNVSKIEVFTYTFEDFKYSWLKKWAQIKKSYGDQFLFWVFKRFGDCSKHENRVFYWQDDPPVSGSGRFAIGRR